MLSIHVVVHDGKHSGAIMTFCVMHDCICNRLFGIILGDIIFIRFPKLPCSWRFFIY